MLPARVRAGARSVARALACLAVSVPVVVAPAAPAGGDEPGAIASGAEASAVAVRIRPASSGDVVSVSEVSQLSTAVQEAAASVAASVGASSALATGFSAGMVAVRRGGTDVQRAGGSPGLWQFPTGVTAMPADAIRGVMGDRVASAVGAGSVAMGATSAGLRGARAGDVIDLVGADGATVSFTIGVVAPDAEVGGTEIVMTAGQAALLGPVDPSRVLVYGSFDRTALEAAFAARGMFDGEQFAGRRIRIRRSWAPADPDGTIGLARTKLLLGEFDYLLGSSGSVDVDPAWRDASIVRTEFTHIGIRAYCHVAVRDDLQAALTEVAAAGLSHAIDVANTNSYGGCFYPRFNRVTGNLGFLSRHSWGQALDMNTVTNAQGAVPQMDCRVVRIFRKHGFAWGGNFLSSDGMHFEWVGERRDQLPYPSRYCPNEVTAPTSAHDRSARATARATFFAADGWDVGADAGTP